MGSELNIMQLFTCIRCQLSKFIGKCRKSLVPIDGSNDQLNCYKQLPLPAAESWPSSIVLDACTLNS